MISYAFLSNSGDREYNEDYIKVANNGHAFCFVLADGLGGHGGGRAASRLVAEYIGDEFMEHGELSEQYIKHCFAKGQERLLAEQDRQQCLHGMRTTLVILMVDEDTALWGHIGDSRLYYFQKAKLVQRTLDHSVPQMLALAGKIKEKEIRGHADRNRLLRAMGTSADQELRCEIAQPIHRNGGEAFLLCSDGFWEWIEEKKMQSLLRKAKSPQEWLEQMHEKVQKKAVRGRMDNYSAVAVFLD